MSHTLLIQRPLRHLSPWSENRGPPHDVNETPTDITLSNTTVAENQVFGTLVGSLGTVDQDSGNTFTYTLVSGTGSADNSSFTIDSSGNLKTTASFDFEARNSYSIRVRSTDQGGLFTEKAFTIGVSNVNEAPTDITLSNAIIAENQPAGTIVGNLSTTDPDAGNTFLYTLVAGVGGADNGSFTIDANGNLKTSTPLDYEAQNLYSIRVRSTDQGGLFVEKAYTVSVTNVNETPTDIALSNASVAENQPAGTVVGTFSSTDPDAGNTFSYTLASGTGSADNTSFTIDASGNLKTTAAFDYEAKNSYSIRVRSTDQGGLFTEKSFTIAVSNVNETPTNIALSNAAIAENQPAGVVGAFSTADPDAGNTFAYTLVSGTGSTDNASFTIDANGNLKSAAAFDYEAKNSYSIRVRSTDQGGLFTEKAFTIGVANVNETPTDIALSNASIAENQPAGTTIGAFSTTDPDGGNTFTYILVSGTGSTDNASFTIDANGNLKTAAAFDYEAKSIYSIRVRSTDEGGLFTEKAFTIGVVNVNEAPTAVGLQGAITSLPENTSTVSPITLGTIVVTDDSLGTNTLTLSGADVAAFDIVNGQLVLRAGTVLNYEAKTSYSVTVNADDATVGGTPDASRNYVLSVSNVNEAPTVTPQTFQVKTGSKAGTVVGTVSATDPDSGQTLTYSIISGDTQNAFAINAATGQITISSAKAVRKAQTFSLVVQATDNGSPSLSGQATITINVVKKITTSAPPTRAAAPLAAPSSPIFAAPVIKPASTGSAIAAKPVNAFAALAAAQKTKR